MVNKKMKSLITDLDLLIYIHDVIFLAENNKNFFLSKSYGELYENGFITAYRYLKWAGCILVSFILLLLSFKKLVISSLIFKYGAIIIISVIYGVMFVKARDDLKKLKYQLHAKKAVQYALANYNYQEYMFFLDSYLSEHSTKNYLKLKKGSWLISGFFT